MPAALLTLAVVTLIHLVAQGTAPGGVVCDLTQVLLMPLLAWVLLVSTPNPKSQLVRLVSIALGFSWLGDTVPRFFDEGSEAGFWWMVALFTLAQIAYVAAFLPFARRSILRTRPKLLALPIVIALALLVLTLDGNTVSPVMLYVVAILLMAVLATGLDRVATIGAVIFVVSDGLIALGTLAGVELPLHGVWVMLTYVVGQALLVAAVGHHDRAVAARQA